MRSPISVSEAPAVREIVYLSPPAAVNMADRWFEISALDHFWVRRRFEVLRRLAGNLISGARELSEIGCGHGLLQRQIEKAYGRPVAGFDLNEFALKENQSRLSKICCYDVFQMDSSLRERFDLIFLFDVLEHVAEEDRFLRAILFHLAPGGRLVVNVPSGQWLYSAYDRANGHERRYSARSFRAAASRNNLKIANWSYWGLPLLPTLIVRKFWLMGKSDPNEIVASGFDSRHDVVNRLLGVVSRCEKIPQTFMGTSLMAVLQPVKSAKGQDRG